MLEGTPVKLITINSYGYLYQTHGGARYYVDGPMTADEKRVAAEYAEAQKQN